ncbi:MAG: hypothetical protein KME21_29815 [Desmonostoc vinosum HA7617-LM4]|jgi:hypothetical protein|nr:hypothetical protein [Desmonostoc vinosum HA7617-LM4]
MKSAEDVQGRGDAEKARRGERIQAGFQSPSEFKPLNRRFSGGLKPLGLASPRPRVFLISWAKQFFLSMVASRIEIATDDCGMGCV